MKPENCWEVMKCGRQPGGENAWEHGICPATLLNKYDGINYGKNGGRFCWAVAGTFCGGKIQGTFAKKPINCVNCKFFKIVQDQESNSFVFLPKDKEKQKAIKKSDSVLEETTQLC